MLLKHLFGPFHIEKSKQVDKFLRFFELALI
jgi:hypothetical protein